jgi:phosphate transport system protein
MEIRTEFHKQLREIQQDVIFLGSMVEKAIARSVNALRERDLAEAQEVIAADKAVNNKRYEIEMKCLAIIAKQQPMATDLRTVMGVTHIITELERIGDYAEGIARIVIMNGDEPPLKPLVSIPRMADKTIDMLKRAMEAFIGHDATKARQVAMEDDEVDNLYSDLFRVLVSYMVEDPKTITRATRLIWAAHNMERAADRVTNICERIVFTVTGKLEEIGASNY